MYRTSRRPRLRRAYIAKLGGRAAQLVGIENVSREIAQRADLTRFVRQGIGPLAELLKQRRDRIVLEVLHPVLGNAISAVGIVRKAHDGVRRRGKLLVVQVRERAVIQRAEGVSDLAIFQGAPYQTLTVPAHDGVLQQIERPILTPPRPGRAHGLVEAVLLQREDAL